tara:strand:+ start:1333 stop:1944 length:612 start_codon:yes stop_codon:yes gene_type:complete
MQPDKEKAIYIGVTNNCDNMVVEEISKYCLLLTDKNSSGGQLLLVTESNVDYPLADYLINMVEGDVFLTRSDKAFNVKLDSNNALAEVLYALTASWFLANLVGHDYADYINCFRCSKRSHLDIIEISNIEKLLSFLSIKKHEQLPTAMTCYIEAVEIDMELEWFGEVGNALLQYVNEEAYCLVTMSSIPIQQSNSKIYLTWFY